MTTNPLAIRTESFIKMTLRLNQGKRFAFGVFALNTFMIGIYGGSPLIFKIQYINFYLVFFT